MFILRLPDSMYVECFIFSWPTKNSWDEPSYNFVCQLSIKTLHPEEPNGQNWQKISLHDKT